MDPKLSSEKCIVLNAFVIKQEKELTMYSWGKS